jgi:hypothetical protein
LCRPHSRVLHRASILSPRIASNTYAPDALDHDATVQ